MNDYKLNRAKEAAELIKSASIKITKALEIMEANDLNLENYPEYWHDFNEHPDELRNIIVSDFASDSDIQVVVGENR